jgi:putative IMPACT (imprinted ancient) family translation regulator
MVASTMVTSVILALSSRGVAFSRPRNLLRRRMLRTEVWRSFTTIQGEVQTEYSVKKSRFVAHCSSALSFDDARAFIERVSDHKARHNCWAWFGTQSQRSNDDGEPQGTAGRPILNAIEGEDLVDVVVVVTRYKAHDAPKLGAGGLLRAYGSASSLALRAASRVDVFPRTTLDLSIPMTHFGAAQSLLARYEGRTAGSGSLRRQNSEEYDESGYVNMQVSIEIGFTDKLTAGLADATNGMATVEMSAEEPPLE